jgi:hypothetical protein
MRTVLQHGTGFISGRATLSDINMSTVKCEILTPVTDVSYFKPNKERDDVITSLEDLAAGLLKPDITGILKVAKKNSNTKRRFNLQKSQLTSSSLTQTTQLHVPTFVTKNPPTPACPIETVTKLPMNCS